MLKDEKLREIYPVIPKNRKLTPKELMEKINEEYFEVCHAFEELNYKCLTEELDDLIQVAINMKREIVNGTGFSTEHHLLCNHYQKQERRGNLEEE